MSGKDFFGAGQNDFRWVRDSDVGNRPPRISCDTSCRTVEQQVKEFVRKLYEVNPYLLVDTK